MSLNRRSAIKSGLAMISVTAVPGIALAQTKRKDRMTERYGEREIAYDGVSLSMPPIAENGYSVPMSVTVESAMTEADYVKSITIISDRNPVAEIARFTLGPQAGRAKVDTRIRLGGTQRVTAIAEMQDGRLRAGTADVVVTLAACVVL